MMNFDAVLFDWMLTLAHYPSEEEHVVSALRKLGRDADSVSVGGIVANLNDARNHPDAKAASLVEDTSREAHSHSEFLVYEKAGLDAELASAMYELLGTPDFHAPYPDSKSTLRILKDAGLSTGVVSDIHSDLRLHALEFGWIDLIDAWSLSWEQGIQKPDPKMFQTAIDQLGVDPAKTVMVGDRGAIDGAAAMLGVTCLILPKVNITTPDQEQGLSIVSSLVGLE